ncbi:MAG: lamin tail domain-containing protein [Planctomycetes bacterium]|nr:lamin tail domain-containing protein [Planctomycetota bacterium]
MKKLSFIVTTTASVVAIFQTAFADSTVVFNEILYHAPAGAGEVEWVELFNQMGVDMDVSNWRLAGGIDFHLPEGTIVPGGGFLVIARSPAALETATGYAGALGPYTGRLDNRGDLLELRNNNDRLMDKVDYKDSGAWPAAPDGSGASLAKTDPDAASAPAGSWSWSAQAGGTPGKPNFAGGGELAARVLAFNETSIAGADSWIEITNRGPEAVPLEGHVLMKAGGAGGEFIFPEGTLAPLDFLVLTAAQLGFGLDAGDRLFLFSPPRNSIHDAIRLENDLHGRQPQATGPWLVPDQPTPGAANRFTFHDEIVINEIMYHQRSAPEVPARVEEVALIPLESAWKYDPSGKDPGPQWLDPDFDDRQWASGQALFYNETASLPAAKNTPLDLGPVTYYFRAEFEFKGDPAAAQLGLRFAVDDGAVFYLNGVEIYRFNLPPGEVGASTLATPSVGNASLRGPFPVSSEFLNRGRNVLAVEVHQAAAESDDVVFGAALQASVTISTAVPFRESPEAWLEIFNRGAASVDLTGWRLDGGIEFAFEDGTRLAPGEYLVVAKDQEFLRARYPDGRIAGDFKKRLSHKSDLIILRDGRGNPADEVRYFDGGRWPEHPDGGGSSLELRDPRADNSRAEAWAASDESAKSKWQSFTYRGPAVANVGPTRWNEFVLGLLDDGEILIDDLSVLENPDANPAQLLQNGAFDKGIESWRLLGTHRLSEVVPDPDDPANPVLHLIATGPTEHMHNHLETTLANNRLIQNGKEYQISFRARWLAGSNQLNTRLYFNRLPRTTLLETPERTGTPGARNSSHQENIGPTYSDFRHAPAAPEVDQETIVSARADDPDGVQSCALWWSVNGGGWSSAPMALGAGGLFTGAIPGQAKAAIVQFYVEGTDGRGASSTFPAGGRGSRALYKVNDDQARPGAAHNLRIVMTPADANFLHLETNVMSNESLGTTVVYDEKEVFYDAGVSLRGSERGRSVDSRAGFLIKFHPDRLFRGVHSSVSVDRAGGWIFGQQFGQDEIVIKHIINHAGGIPGMYDDLIRVIAPRQVHTGPALLLMAKFGDIFLDSQYQNGSDGTTYKLELIYYPTSTINGKPDGLKRPQPDDVLGTDLRDLGNDKEVYRWNFLIENNRARDDYSRMIELCKTLGLTGAQLEARAQEVMDVDEWLRAFAIYGLCGINDTYTFGNNHNNIYYVRPEDQKMLVFPWDMDFAFVRGATDSLIGDQNLSKVLNLPRFQRRFYWHVRDIVETTFNGDYMDRWTAHYGAMAGRSYAPILNYIKQRRTFALGRVPKPVAFAITTNGGQDYSVNESSTLVEGSASIEVARIALAERPAEPLQVAWVSLTRWRAAIPLEFGENALTFLAFDETGPAPLASAALKITSTSGWPRPAIAAVDPPAGIAGGPATIGGTEFHAGIRVFFGSRPALSAAFDEAHPESITVTIPPLPPGLSSITVRNADGRASKPYPFTIVLPSGPLFIRGDAGRNGAVNISDAVLIISHLFRGAPLSCLDAADVDDSEAIDLTDAILLLDFLFLAGTPPRPPFPRPGPDFRGAAIDCKN